MWVQATVSHPNVTIRYRLVTMTPGFSSGFSVDRHTGIVTTTTALRPETTYTVRFATLFLPHVSKSLKGKGKGKVEHLLQRCLQEFRSALQSQKRQLIGMS